MEERVIEESKKLIKTILDEGINANNIENLYKLSKIKHIAKEDKEMNYGNYGRGSGYSGYGRGGYGAGYRGFDHLDRVYSDYGRYEEGRERYGAGEETKKNLKYMLTSMEEFAKMLKEESSSPDEVQMIRETAQRIASM